MHIAILGASGATGKLLTERFLAAGHQVTALLRTPEAFSYRTRVRIIHGNAFDPVAIAATFAGANAVFSALGTHSLKKQELLERAVPLIIDAMHNASIERIVVLSAAGALPTSLDKQPTWRRWLGQKIIFDTILKNPMASETAQYAALSASNLDWTIVMPPMLTNSPARGIYRVDGAALPRNATRISRADVADFMLQQLIDEQWIRKGVYLSW